MADPLSVSSGVVALVTFALQTSVTLYTTIRSLQSQDKNARALKGEVSDLTGVLQSLLETVTNNPEIDFDGLKFILYRCGKTCEQYGVLVTRCTKHSQESRPSVRDWVTQKYLQGDITDFKEMLATYKSTINIALANANIRVASITPKVLEELKDMIFDTTSDLQEHLKKLDQRVQELTVKDGQVVARDEVEWLAMLEEMESAQQGLRICSQLSAQIEKLESTSKENPQFSQRPSAHKYIRTGLGAAKGPIETLLSRLQNHADDIGKKMEAMQSTQPLSGTEASQLTQLQEIRKSLQDCVEIVAKAGDNVANERYNVFEDITMSGNSYGMQVSTVKDLVIARRVNLQDQSRYLGGQISDESYQRTVDALTQLDMKGVPLAQRDLEKPPSKSEPETGGEATSVFHSRYGHGFHLSPSDTNVNPSQSAS